MDYTGEPVSQKVVSLTWSVFEAAKAVLVTIVNGILCPAYTVESVLSAGGGFAISWNGPNLGAHPGLQNRANSHKHNKSHGVSRISASRFVLPRASPIVGVMKHRDAVFISDNNAIVLRLVNMESVGTEGVGVSTLNLHIVPS